MSEKFEKMAEFTESLYNIIKIINKKAEEQKNKRLKLISIVIFNYVLKTVKDNNIKLDSFTNAEIEINQINLEPIFEYINHNKIELYDFSKIDVNDVDISKTSDLERFALTHVYYLTQLNEK